MIEPKTYTEQQIREFCGYLSGYLDVLENTHPGMIWAAWESYLAARQRQQEKAK